MKRRLIGIIYFALGLVLTIFLARAHIEWVWFHQFNLEVVYIKTLAFQLIGFSLGAILSFVSYHWLKRWNKLDRYKKPNLSEIAFKGWKYSLVLVLFLLIITTQLFLLSRLSITAIYDPFNVTSWFSRPLGNVFNTYIIISFLILSIYLLFRSDIGSRIVNQIGFLLFSFIVSRSWGLWSISLAIPQSGLVEPVNNSDISFALGKFPAITFGLLLVLIVSILTASCAYWSHLTKRPRLSEWNSSMLTPSQKMYLRPLVIIIIFCSASLLWLSRHQLLWAQDGIVPGAGWLDLNLIHPVRTSASVALFLVALLLIPIKSFPYRRILRIFLAALLLVLGVVEIFIAPFIQWIFVRPRELTLETPYFVRAISSTRKAFQLDSISTRLLNPQPRLTKKDVEEASNTLKNIRLWDSQPLLATNRQLQQLRVYYQFSNAAVDRYKLKKGSDELQQVMITARELDQEILPDSSRTWLNRHFVFTHGYGFTLSPVNTKAEDGLPDYFISDLGESTRIEGSKSLEIEKEDVSNSIPIGRAALYFGMLPSPYAIAPTNLEELDYPEGDKNIFNHYAGSAGVSLSSPLTRFAAAIYLSEPRILTTGVINKDSKLLIKREVRQRIKALAPFISIMGDPYLISVSIDKTNQGYQDSQYQYWIVEGFTTSRTYPYSSSLPDGNPLRYIRNSVKAVVDAYSGKVYLYITEPDDPLIKGWNKIFPELFLPVSKMPKNIRKHLKVPTELFDIQVQQLLRYHVKDPRTFYSGDDIWQVPVELYGKKQVPVEPYHITAQLGPNEGSEFLLLQPLSPLARPNLSAWLAARNDGDNYGKLVLLRFPSQTTIFGPEQIQALINQNPEISQQFSLWDRAGSEVIQGNLLVLPIGRSLLYVEPVYLKASQGGLPTLTRIVVSDGKRIVMAKSLSEGIKSLLNKPFNESSKQ
ncbi:UPF0182 family protein [Prochlorococcus sp. MIT 1300]|uniref:UPF0182 family protein n=1 Tax=Prochlorococcus sp. MIT 1300 TaxID=3096218 RepID=UPI002A75BFD7|nr:UPF0182 family protein [Prochlorococcus sp. MIT 1300]